MPLIIVLYTHHNNTPLDLPDAVLPSNCERSVSTLMQLSGNIWCSHWIIVQHSMLKEEKNPKCIRNISISNRNFNVLAYIHVERVMIRIHVKN